MLTGMPLIFDTGEARGHEKIIDLNALCLTLLVISIFRENVTQVMQV